MIKPGTRGLRQRPKIDMRLIMAVVTRYEARQHTGIGGVHVPADERKSHAGFRPPGEAPQHLHMAVAAAQQDYIFVDYSGRLHRLYLADAKHIPFKTNFTLGCHFRWACLVIESS